jgi:hypothetical protein
MAMISARATLIIYIALTIAILCGALTYLGTANEPLSAVAGGAAFAASARFLNELVS